MSSIITENSNEGETILSEVGDFPTEVEFHPDQFSKLVDIQDELDKLEANTEGMMSVSTIDNVNIVDHEVTIVAEQSNEHLSILPEMTESDSNEPMDLDESDTQHSSSQSSFSEIITDSLEIDESITVSTPSVSSQIIESINHKKQMKVGSRSLPVKAAVPTFVSGPPLKAIRPLPVPEALVTKNTSFFTMAQPKKNVMTRVIFSTNNDASDAPIIFGEAGSQAIRIIGQNKTIITNSPKTITLAQAKEMGLISPKKVHQINQGKFKKGVMTMVRGSPTKILPMPIAPSPTTLAGPPQKVFIRQGGTLKAGTLTGNIITNSPGGPHGHIIQVPMSQDNSGQIHQIQLPGKQIQFVRLVNSVSAASLTPSMDTLTTVSSTVPGTANPSQMNVLSLTPTPVSIAPAPISNSFERVIVSPGLNQLSGTQEAKPPNNIVMVPAEFVKHYKPAPAAAAPLPTPPVPPQLGVSKPPTPRAIQPAPRAVQPSPRAVQPAPAPRASAASSASPTPRTSKASSASPAPRALASAVPSIVPKEVSVTNHKPKAVDPPNGIRQRKPCNCTKSQCLKLYCDCFANGEFCYKCNCVSCFNNLNHEEERQRAIKTCLERNPTAFRPKIGKSYIGDERRHNKGCNCRRSGCLKNYCECYEAKIPCSKNCKCVGCRNVEYSKEPKSEDRNKMSQQMAVKNKLSTELQESAHKPHPFTREPFNLMTQEVVEATCQCLLAQVEQEATLTENLEMKIIEEFGRCLVEIIDCAARTSMSSAT